MVVSTMNRFITYARKATSAPFLISIYRDDWTYSGYRAIAWANVRFVRAAKATRQVTQDKITDRPRIRKFS
ncbi:hypothetical protein [Leptolyngbya sp. GGD]|uniref:hypothetical protein n=1 Tax=Leptolyngbya sp. GGD TaxID=2997907 RepID=UPI00227D3218|nr:hypothetical protein [Leptolyngbya sp. GGD]MCY6490714.1 hypothetical protein [Leptolyngbya sp. GGD]